MYLNSRFGNHAAATAAGKNVFRDDIKRFTSAALSMCSLFLLPIEEKEPSHRMLLVTCRSEPLTGKSTNNQSRRIAFLVIPDCLPDEKPAQRQGSKLMQWFFGSETVDCLEVLRKSPAQDEHKQDVFEVFLVKSLLSKYLDRPASTPIRDTVRNTIAECCRIASESSEWSATITSSLFEFKLSTALTYDPTPIETNTAAMPAHCVAFPISAETSFSLEHSRPIDENGNDAHTQSPSTQSNIESTQATGQPQMQESDTKGRKRSPKNTRSASKKRHSSNSPSSLSTSECSNQSDSFTLYNCTCADIVRRRVSAGISDPRTQVFDDGQPTTQEKRLESCRNAITTLLAARHMQSYLLKVLRSESSSDFVFTIPIVLTSSIPKSFFTASFQNKAVSILEKTRIAHTQPALDDLPAVAVDCNPAADVDKAILTLQALTQVAATKFAKVPPILTNLACCPYCLQYDYGFEVANTMRHMETCSGRSDLQTEYMDTVHDALQQDCMKKYLTILTFYDGLVSYLCLKFQMVKQDFDELRSQLSSWNQSHALLPLPVIELLIGYRLPIYFSAFETFFNAAKSGRLVGAKKGRKSKNARSPQKLDLNQFLLPNSWPPVNAQEPLHGDHLAFTAALRDHVHHLLTLSLQSFEPCE